VLALGTINDDLSLVEEELLHLQDHARVVAHEAFSVLLTRMRKPLASELGLLWRCL
jgi:hypothetical protein